MTEQPCYVRLAKPFVGNSRSVPNLCIEIMHPISGALLMRVEMGGAAAWRSLACGSREQATIEKFDNEEKES